MGFMHCCMVCNTLVIHVHAKSLRINILYPKDAAYKRQRWRKHTNEELEECMGQAKRSTATSFNYLPTSLDKKQLNIFNRFYCGRVGLLAFLLLVNKHWAGENQSHDQICSFLEGLICQLKIYCMLA